MCGNKKINERDRETSTCCWNNLLEACLKLELMRGELVEFGVFPFSRFIMQIAKRIAEFSESEHY